MALVLEKLARVCPRRFLDSDVEEFQVEAAVDIAANDTVCFYNFFDLMFDEIVIGIDMLLYETWIQE